MTKSTSAKHFPLFYFLLIIIFGITVYANALNGQFVWDDDYTIKKNVYLKDWSYLPKIFSQHLGAGSGKLSNLYRPLQLLTYMVDYSFWKLDVRGYHLHNILLHILSGLTLYWLINLLYNNQRLALLTSIFFVVHPVHTEAVAYISGRADPLALLFILLSFIFYLKYLPEKQLKFYLMMLSSYTLALLSKETALIFPLLLILYHYIFPKERSLRQLLLIFSLTLIYLVLRLTTLSFPLPATTSPIPGLLQRLPGFFVAIANYIRLLILPFNLHMEYGQRLFRFTHPQAASGIAILVLLLVYAFQKRKTQKLIFFGISWFLLSLLPVSNIYFINAYMAEHWLYLPSIGFFLILADGLNYLYQKKNAQIFALGLTISLLFFYAYLTIKQNNYWRQPQEFYEQTLKFNPQSPRLYLNLANVYLTSGNNQEKAIHLYQKAIALEPNFAPPYNNLGVIYTRMSKKEEAISQFKKALELDPGYADAYNNLGNTYSEMGKSKEAIELLEKAIQLNPLYAQAYANLGIEYFRAGRKEEAINLIKKAIALEPNYAEAYFNLAVAYFKQEKYQLAIEAFDQAQARGFTNFAFSQSLEKYRKK